MTDAIKNKEAETTATKQTQSENASAVQPVPSKGTAMQQPQDETIYDSPPSEPDDDLWLAHGAKMLEDSVPSIHNAASELLKALGMLQSVYLAILGFAKFVPENLNVWQKAFFFIPFAPWGYATYYCLRVMKTEIRNINLRSPSDIRDNAANMLNEKQKNLDMAFLCLVVGIVFTIAAIFFRLNL